MHEGSIKTGRSNSQDSESQQFQSFQNWSKPESQSNLKRMQLRRKIRQRQISQLFNEKRKKLRLLQSMNQHHDGHQSVNAFGNLNIDECIKGNTGFRKSYRQRVQQLLYNYKCDRLAMKKVYMSSDVIRKIWRIVLDSQDQVCLSEQNMRVLIDCAESDVHLLQKTAHNNPKQTHLSQRTGQIIWILLNQCYKSPQISLQTTTSIIKLCLSLITTTHRHPIPQSYSHSQTHSSTQYECGDQYIMGLCIILLGNICVSQQHVYCIMRQVRVSRLVLLLDGKLESDNCEDLSFLFSNLIYYYPMPYVLATNNKGIIGLRQQQLQLLQILQYLYSNLSTDLLLHIHSFQRTTPTNTTPQKHTLNPQQISKHKQKKPTANPHPHPHFPLCLSQLQLTKLSSNQQPHKKSYISQNYTNDVMQCISKIYQLLQQLNTQIVHLQQQQPQLYKQLSEKQRTSLYEIKLANMKVRDVIEKEYEGNVMVNVVRVVLLCGVEGRYGVRLRNCYLFLRNLLRNVGQGMGMGMRSTSGRSGRKMIDIVEIGLCENILGWIHKWITNSNNANQLQKQTDKQIQQNLQNSIWQVYSKLLSFLLEISTTNTTPILQKRSQTLLSSQISYLQSQIFTQKQNNCQSNILPLVAQYYPIISTTNIESRAHEKNKMNLSAMRVRLSEISVQGQGQGQGQNQNSLQSRNSDGCIEYIQIDMQRICELINLLCMKLQQYTDCTTMLYLCLQSIHTVIQRLNTYLTNYQQQQQYTKILQIVLPSHLQKQLRQLLCIHLYNDNTLSNQICDIIQNILYGKKQEELIEMEIEEEYQEEDGEDGEGEDREEIGGNGNEFYQGNGDGQMRDAGM